MATTHLSSLDRSTLKAFENAAAGHDGALSDESGALFIKPSTAQECGFYQTVTSHHPELSECMPAFMGTLNLSATNDGNVETTVLEAIQKLSPEPAKQSIHGRKITTDFAIVLENFEHDFKRANVVDLKLGKTTCAPGTKPDKVERLNKIAAETTTASLGFRITGMKVWNGQSFDIFDKMYGRQFTADDVVDGYAAFFAPMINGLEQEYALHMLTSIRDEVTRIRMVLENCETRMFSASLLINYEGDIEALRRTMTAVSEDTVEAAAEDMSRENDMAKTIDSLKSGQENGDGNDINDCDDSDDEDKKKGSTPFRTGLVDFAHASFVPGQGHDENVIEGLQNIEMQLELLMKRLE